MTSNIEAVNKFIAECIELSTTELTKSAYERVAKFMSSYPFAPEIGNSIYEVKVCLGRVSTRPSSDNPQPMFTQVKRISLYVELEKAKTSMINLMGVDKITHFITDSKGILANVFNADLQHFPSRGKQAIYYDAGASDWIQNVGVVYIDIVAISD